MASWNNTTTRPNWQGNGGANKSKYLVVSTIKADQIVTQELFATTSVITPYVYAESLSTANGSIAFLSNLVLNTGVIGLGVGPTYLTANDGILYVNGDAVAFPSTLSTIADWSYFPAQSHVNMSRSSIYNVQSISTNILSTGILLAGGVSTNNLASGNVAVNNISSGNIFFDTLNGRAGTITTLSGNNVVYSNAVLSNLTSLTHNTRQLNTSNIVASNDLTVPSISTIIVSSFLVEANTLYGQSTATGYLEAQKGQISTIISYNSLIENINGVRTLNLSPIDNYTFWDSNRLYVPGETLYHNTYFYSAIISNRNTEPGVEIQLWISNKFYYIGETGYVEGAGAYIAKANNSFPDSPNNHPDEWDYVGPLRSDVYYWLAVTRPTIYSGTITGNNDSYIQIGNVSTISLNASSINVADVTINNLNARNILSSNIYNSNALQTNSLDVILDSQLNTLTTSGIVNTNNVLNVNGLLALQSDLYGQTQQVPIILPPFSITEYLRSLNDIKNINCEAINVVGGATGNFAVDFRNNSIVNIGETELSPGVVTINGINAELTTALTVNGITSINGDITINGLATINGLTDMNGDCTVLGFMDVGGTLDVAGVTTITGATNIGGVLTVEGETNIAGLLTAEAGIVAVGALGFTGGDITIGGEPATSPINNFNFYNYYRNTNVEALTVNKNGDFRQDVGVAGNLNVGGIIFGTVVSGSESISTLNVSTLRAFNISSITNTTQEFFVSSIAGYSNRIIEFNNDIKVPAISTNTLNMINGTGNQLVLQSYDGREPILGFNRTINGVNFLDVVIGTTEETGFIVAGFSTISISALNDIRIGSAENVNLIAGSNVNLIAENVTVSTNTFVVENVAGISSIYTNYINTPLVESRVVDLYSQDVENPIAAVVFSRNIDGEKVGDGSIAIDNVNGFQIASASTIRITANDDMLIRSIQGNTILFNENSNIILSAPETIIPYNLNVSSISTGYVIANTLIATNGIGTTNVFTSNLFSDYTSTGSIYANSATIVNDLSANNLFTTNLLTYFIGNPLPFQSPVTFNDNLNISGNNISNTFLLQSSNISTNFLSTGNLFVNNYTGNSINTNLISSGSLLSGVITTPALSTTTISTSVLNTNSINAPVNINCGKSLIPFSGNNLDLGASGAFRWRNLWVSTISSIHVQTSTIATTQIAVDRIVGNASATNIFTNNLFPISAGAQLGYNSGGTAGGGFYNNLSVRSTFTQVINPSGEAGRFSNAVYINTNLSTQNIQVSTINRKLYPYSSTFGILDSASTFRFEGTTATTPQIMYSNITFPHVGTYIVQGKNTISKATGGSGAEAYGFFSLSRGLYPSTFNTQDAFNSVPFMGVNNISTFNTFTSELYVSSMNTNTRFITYTDYTGHNYTLNFGLGQLRATYIPSQGINPE